MEWWTKGIMTQRKWSRKTQFPSLKGKNIHLFKWIPKERMECGISPALSEVSLKSRSLLVQRAQPCPVLHSDCTAGWNLIKMQDHYSWTNDSLIQPLLPASPDRPLPGWAHILHSAPLVTQKLHAKRWNGKAAGHVTLSVLPGTVSSVT